MLTLPQTCMKGTCQTPCLRDAPGRPVTVPSLLYRKQLLCQYDPSVAGEFATWDPR